MPSSIQRHAFATSAAHAAVSAWAAQGSAPAPSEGVPSVPLPEGLLTLTLPAPHAHVQDGQNIPGAQIGHAQVHVPPPVPPPQAPRMLAALLLPPQSQVQGGQVSPGAQAGHAQVHVPPPVLPGVALEQSHSTAGQAVFAGQAIGWTQVQPPPEAARAWQ
jgi:hypothetical protein